MRFRPRLRPGGAAGLGGGEQEGGMEMAKDGKGTEGEMKGGRRGEGEWNLGTIWGGKQGGGRGGGRKGDEEEEEEARPLA